MKKEKCNIRILVVDNEEGVRDMLQMILEMETYQVVVVGNGVEALATMEKEEFDLIITDLMMSQMDGLQLLCELRKKQNPIQVIMTTGHSHEDTAKNAIEKGAFDCLIKPYSMRQIVSVVEKALASAPC